MVSSKMKDLLYISVLSGSINIPSYPFSQSSYSAPFKFNIITELVPGVLVYIYLIIASKQTKVKYNK